MKKSTKAVLAAGAAVVVLTGGAGSLAYWNATADIGGGTITAGELDLTPVAGTGTWTFNGTPVADPTAVVIVPGDELAYTGSFTITAEGDNLEGTVDVVGGAGAGGLVGDVTLDVVPTIDGAAATTVTEADDGDVLDVAIDISFPFGTTVDNTSQTETLDLTGVDVVITQTDATP
ncbi:hypothetical protein GCM10009737_32660 [Nocardioides lentus]|uniref:Alternate-type signal peptide domain-containing protein n=1 Tax=Nocardioides lentus TaxID=338077 RepID=A0ABN2PPQ2_9ACTN